MLRRSGAGHAACPCAPRCSRPLVCAPPSWPAQPPDGGLQLALVGGRRARACARRMAPRRPVASSSTAAFIRPPGAPAATRSICGSARIISSELALQGLHQAPRPRPGSRRFSNSSVNSVPGQVDRGAPRRRSPAPRRRARAIALAALAAGGSCASWPARARPDCAESISLGAEHREPQALGLAVDVAVGAQLLLLEEAGGGRSALVASCECSASAPAGRPPGPRRSRSSVGAPAVLVPRWVWPAHRRRLRLGVALQPEVEVEQPVEGLNVLGALDQRRPEGVAHGRSVGEAHAAAGPRARQGPRRGRPASRCSRRKPYEVDSPGAPLSARDRGCVRDRGDDGGGNGRVSGRRCARSPGGPSSHRGRT